MFSQREPPIQQFTGAYRFLSNFYAHEICYGELVAPTNEHLFQALKTRRRSDQQWVLDASTPGEAKRRGRSVKLRPAWDSQRDNYMALCVRLKFPARSSMALRLLDTGAALLEEGNTWGDRYWGKVNGRGENRLGHLLMARRHHLRLESCFPQATLVRVVMSGHRPFVAGLVFVQGRCVEAAPILRKHCYNKSVAEVKAYLRKIGATGRKVGP